ncbi:MAG: fibronectin type III domain-containing protein [Treponema sp.]|nr:fibronectin type III domain-containing protein [Treponema sp.]
MKKKIALFFVAIFAMFFCVGTLMAQEWSAVPNPKILSVAPSAENPGTVIIKFDYPTDTRQDKIQLDILENGNVLESKTMGRSRNNVKETEYVPTKSGKYSVRITGIRTGETTKKGPVSKAFNFSFPLASPNVELLNQGKGTLRVTWNYVHEAETYEITYKDGNKKEVTKNVGRVFKTVLEDLTIGEKTTVKVAAVRGTEKKAGKPTIKTIIEGKDREWKHTWFGQSTKENLNTMEMIDADNLKFKLNSCTYDEETGNIGLKGGKFTSFHDGVSFYYTEIDAATENFDLEATFTIDYINIAADGQEGFGIVCYDHLGKHGVFSQNHYTNSVAILATKMEERFGEVKKTSKDTLGVRFTQGITPEVLKKGDAGIAESGLSEVHAFSYDASEIVKKGDVYRIRMKKDNSGYTCYYDKEIKSEDTITEFTLWGPEKLLQLDKEKVYVGFAVARGCNATVSDIKLTITDPKKDPPRQEEPPKIIQTTVKIDSPVAYGIADYVMNITPNADGIVTVKDTSGKIWAENLVVKANKYVSPKVKLIRGINDFVITFKPDENFRPGEKMRIGSYDKELKMYVENYDAINITHSVMYNTYKGRKLYVSPSGNALNKGTKDSPLDLVTAINYAMPGQPIIMLDGTYYPTRGLIFERGNNGNAKKRKVLKADKGTRPIIDFGSSNLAMQLWADYWTLEGFDLTNSPENIKALHIGGNHNIIKGVNAYLNRDTGIQISGMAIEAPERWPTHNLVLNCTSWGNCDPAENNADGFGAKLTCGEGNVFRGCIAYSNIDDGWDLYSKIETGPISPVLIENCIAFKNGTKPDGTGNGDGNGFKLGGDGIAVPHVLKNSIAYLNGMHGITSNSDPAIILINNTSYGNKSRNISLYGKGKETPRTFVTQNNISMEGGEADEYAEMPQLASKDNYFWTGAESKNSEGKKIQKDIFESVDMTIMPGRKANGNIDMKGLFEKNNKAPKGIGADL